MHRPAEEHREPSSAPDPPGRSLRQTGWPAEGSDPVAGELLELSRALSAAGGTEEVLRETMDRIPAILGCSQVQAYLWDGDAGVFRLAAQRGFDPATAQSFQEASPVTSEAAAPFLVSLEEPFVLPRDVVAAVPTAHLLPEVRDVLVAPLRFEPGGFGALSILAPEADPTFTERQIRLARGIADMASLAIGSAARLDQLARFHDLVEGLSAIFWEAEPETLRLSFVSGQAEAILGPALEGWNREPRTWGDHIHPEDRARCRRWIRRAVRRGGEHRMEYRAAPGGRAEWLRDQVHVVRGARGDVRVLRGLMVDATERHRAEEQIRDAEARYRALVEQTPAVTYVESLDDEGATLYVSPQVEGMFGYPLSAWEADPHLRPKLLHPDDRGGVLEAARRSRATGEKLVGQYRVIARDGRPVWVRDEAVLVRDGRGRPLFWQGVMVDITGLKRAEEALRESERREREAALRLRSLDEMKNTFLAAVSHELRSPLTSILGFALTLEQQEVPPEESRDLVRRLAENARKLERILTDLLDFDRLGRGIIAPQRRPTDVAALLRRAVQDSEFLAGRAVHVEAGSITASIDPAKVERIVENLLANVARHTPAGTTVWVWARPEGDGVLLAVEDEGPGVPDDLKGSVFEPFRQGPGAGHAPGTGIGLSLVAGFAELHGGRAWVEDRSGGGASFRVLLPPD